MYLNDTSTRNIREVAKALLREIESSGHVCLHSEDWGAIKADMAAMKKEITGGDGVPSLRVEMAGIRTERKIVAYLINIAVGLVAAILGAKWGR